MHYTGTKISPPPRVLAQIIILVWRHFDITMLSEIFASIHFPVEWFLLSKLNIAQLDTV